MSFCPIGTSRRAAAPRDEADLTFCGRSLDSIVEKGTDMMYSILGGQCQASQTGAPIVEGDHFRTVVPRDITSERRVSPTRMGNGMSERRKSDAAGDVTPELSEVTKPGPEAANAVGNLELPALSHLVRAARVAYAETSED